MKPGNKDKTCRTEPAASIDAANKRLRRGGRSLTSFPLTVLAVVLFLTIGVLSFAAWQDWNLGKDHELMVQEAQVVHQLASRLVHLDDAFMIPVPMAIATGDMSWEKRYHEVEAELDIELDEIGVKAIKIIDDKEGVARLKESKNVLAGLYERIFELMHEGKLEEGRALLNGSEYQQASKVFTESIMVVGQDLQSHVDMHLGEHKREGLLTFAMAGVAVPIILVVWVFAIRIVRNHIVLRKRAEGALRQSEERFRSLVGNIPGIVYRCAMDREWTMYHMSDMVESVTGYPASDFINNKVRSFASIIHPDDREMVWQQSAVMVDGRKAFNLEYRVIAADGSTKWILEGGQVVSGESGTGRWLDGVIFDITERKQVQEQVENLAKFPSENPNPVLRVNRDGAIIYANDAAQTVLKNLDVCVGESVPEKWRQSIMEAFESSENIIKEVWVDDRLFSFGITAVTEAGYANLYGSDITERKAFEDERERLMAMVTGTNRELESVVRVISHDLRAPLVNIHGFSNELVNDCQRVQEFVNSAGVSQEIRAKLSPVLEESVPQSLEYITKSAEKMDKLLGGLTHLSRVGKARLKIQTLDVNELVNSIVKTMQFQLKEGGIAVTVDALPECRGDEVQINQVFSNLLNNAVKYLDPKRAGEIRVSGCLEDGRSVYRVDDNGIGIAPEHQGKIFELFHRLHPNGKVAGEGIGLSVVMRILDRLEGEIWVESEVGVGSSFFVSLPVGQA